MKTIMNSQTDSIETEKSQPTENPFSLPAPKGNFLLGNLIDFAKDPLLFMTKCFEEYGEIVPLRLADKKAILISKPEYIQQILRERDTFHRSNTLKSLYALLGKGILTSEGETWFRQRRLSQPIFHKKRINNYGEVMVEYSEKMVANWEDGQILDIQTQMMRLSFDIVMKTIFNRDASEQQAGDVAKAMNISAKWLLAQIQSLVPIPAQVPTPGNISYLSSIKKLDKYIYQIIGERRISNEDTGDLLSMMMQAKDEDDGSQMTDKQLRDEIATLIFAGHETSANTLTWIWMLLSQNPDKQVKLQQELKQVLGDRSPQISDIPNLPYTNMVIKEAMRLYPVVWNVNAETSRECKIGNYQVPADCSIFVSQWIMHRSEKYFEDAQSFKPERWESDLEKQLPAGVYIPFGGGPRTCIGKNFALMEAVLLLTTIAQKFEINLVPNQTIIPAPTVTLQPKNGIKVSLKKR